MVGTSDSTGWVCGSNPAHLHYQVEANCGSWWCQSVASSFMDWNVLTQEMNGVPLAGQTVTSANAQNYCTSASVSTDVTSPTMVGYPSNPNPGDIHISASSSGCPSPIFQFWIDPPNGSWTPLGSYTAATSDTWNSSGQAPGNWGFGVWVHDSSNPNSSGPNPLDTNAGIRFILTAGCPQSSNVAAVPSPASPQPTGTTVTIYGTSAGCPYPEYAFWYRSSAGSWTLLKDYAPYGSPNYYLAVWHTTGFARDNYYLGVWVRESGTTGTTCGSLGCYDANASATYTLN